MAAFTKSFFVLRVPNKPLVCLKREPPLGFWVRSHHCLCHHLLWLPNLCSGNQGSQTSTEANTMERWWWWWRCKGGGLLSVTLHKAATASTRLIGLKSSAPPLLQREHEEPNAWQDNCEVILTARDAMRVGSLSCKRWPARRQLNMLPSKVVNYRDDIDVERPFWPGDLNPLAISLFCVHLLKAL